MCDGSLMKSEDPDGNQVGTKRRYKATVMKQIHGLYATFQSQTIVMRRSYLTTVPKQDKTFAVPSLTTLVFTKMNQR